MPIGEGAHPAGVDRRADERGGGVEDEKIVPEPLHLHELDAHAASIADAMNRCERRADILRCAQRSRSCTSAVQIRPSFETAADESVLDAALRAGIEMPHRCMGGNCGCLPRAAARGRGEVSERPSARPSGAEVPTAWCCFARRHARSDLVIETFEPGTPRHAARQAPAGPCRAHRAPGARRDGCISAAARPPRVSISSRGNTSTSCFPRAGAAASRSPRPPHDARPLELHVRRAPGGEFSEQVVCRGDARRRAPARRTSRNCIYRESAGPEAPPMLLIGRRHRHCSAEEHRAPCDGERLAAADDAVLGRAQRARSVRARLSQEAARRERALALCARSVRAFAGLGRPPRAGARGGARRCRRLARHEIYASGPPAMIDAVRREFTRRGVPTLAMLHSTPSTTRPDSPARQRTTADTKS